MPIYAYRCVSCGFEKDHLQKLSDPLITVCPDCGQETYHKQLTAAGFQLKGGGWYATDFKDKGSRPASSASDTATTAASATTESPPPCQACPGAEACAAS